MLASRGLESQAELKFCRSVALIQGDCKGRAAQRSHGRSDGVPQIKEMVQNLKIEKVTEVSRAMDKMNRGLPARSNTHENRWRRKQKTAAERRESMLGVHQAWSGAGFMLFLTFFSRGCPQLDPDIINKVPFDIPSVVRVAWLIGLIPVCPTGSPVRGTDHQT
jgi:hypothetical protein